MSEGPKKVGDSPPPAMPPEVPAVLRPEEPGSKPAHGQERDEFISGAPPGAPQVQVVTPHHSLFPVKKGAPPISLTLDFTLSPRPVEDEIFRVVQAIVSQDHDLYPNGDARFMSTGAIYYNHRKYKVGALVFCLQTLIGWVRVARGATFQSSDISGAEIINEWKRKLGVVEAKEVAPAVIPISIDFELPEIPTEEQIFATVRAIVLQDKELYPEGDATRMSTGHKYFHDRRYQIGNHEVTLNTLCYWLRRARGMKGQDKTELKDTDIIRELRNRIGFKKEPEREIITIRLDFTLSETPAEAEVLNVVRAIVAQDKANYPDGDATPMTTGALYFKTRRYQVNGQTVCLDTLARWWRAARGLRGSDTKALRNGDIVAEWRKQIGFKESDRNVLPIHIDFILPNEPTGPQIIAVVGAIVDQDEEYYPGKDPTPMSCSAKYFSTRWYRIGELELTLYTLVGWYRRSKGFKVNEIEKLKSSAIIDEFKMALGFEVKKQTRVLSPIGLDFEIPRRPSEEHVFAIVSAIVSQDQEIYPDGNADLLSSEKASKKRYKAAKREFSLHTLCQWVRMARGLRADASELKSSAIINEWK
ncbi:MAG: hypothetical protein Q7T11_05060, partial [Deltaproteobacteria bacterium]|nr:hypothetical protein [Deltaproteobacteria bacterium]